MINNSPSFSSPSGTHSFTAPSSSPQPSSWANAEGQPHIGMSHSLIEHSFAAEHTNSVAFQPMFNNPFPASFQPSSGVPALGAPAPMLVQQPMYVAQHLNSFCMPSTPTQLVKMEQGTDMFAPHEFPAFPSSQPMLSSMSLPNYATHAPDRRFTFSDAESLSSVASPSSTSDASSRPTSAKRGAKRKNLADASLDSPAAVSTPDDFSDAVKATKKASRQNSQRRPPPSASHITESGKPFPVIDTSAKHSSLFVPPDTSGLTKREARLVKNRAAAFLSRQRKREQFEEMEIKCKGISMLVWRMWETIAGPDAAIEHIDSTPLAAVLANEEPMARLCLEEVISKKGASIAPTADDAEGTPAPESQPQLAPKSSNATPASSAQKDNQVAASTVELEQARCDLAASLQRESDLLAQLDALRASVAAAQSSMTANSLPVTDFDAMDVNATQAMSVGSMAFKGMQGAELPLFVPESPLSKFTVGDASNTAMLLDASHTAGFDLSKTPTLAMFSENALRTRSAPRLGNTAKLASTGMGLGLDYRFPCASAPSSPSTASSSSVDSSQSRANSLISLHSPSSRKAPSTLASVLLLAGMSLMGVGPSANELTSAEASSNAAAATSSRKQVRTSRRTTAASRAAPTQAAGQPSSHLSDDDLLVEMGLASASLSEAEPDAHDEDIPSVQSARATAVSCA